MRRLIAAAAVVALAGCGAGGGAQDRGLTIHVDKSPFRITLLKDGKTVVAEDAKARLRYQLAGTGDQHSLTRCSPPTETPTRWRRTSPGGRRPSP